MKLMILFGPNWDETKSELYHPPHGQWKLETGKVSIRKVGNKHQIAAIFYRTFMGGFFQMQPVCKGKMLHCHSFSVFLEMNWDRRLILNSMTMTRGSTEEIV